MAPCPEPLPLWLCHSGCIHDNAFAARRTKANHKQAESVIRAEILQPKCRTGLRDTFGRPVNDLVLCLENESPSKVKAHDKQADQYSAILANNRSTQEDIGRRKAGLTCNFGGSGTGYSMAQSAAEIAAAAIERVC